MRNSSTWLAGILAGSLAVVVVGLGPGCGSNSDSGFPNPGEDGGPGNDADPGQFHGGLGDGSTGSVPCTTGLCVYRKSCANGGDTTLSGVAYDPAGKNPLYDVFVYVPNAPLADIPTGPSCDRCDGTSNVYSGSPVSYALTDSTGHFKLPNVPVPPDGKVPLVLQLGKWRREKVTVPVTECKDTDLTATAALKDSTRLPKNQSEGHIPLIAITTGGADSMECLPRRMGIDDSEFATSQGGTGRIHLY
ncbi:MAG TPA: carboxypeptidase regulatory-like domain-containing protein, partial [Polyangiaceae bacterium]|nr:carboxypeptidase regulatory-like domain-containing protein [Polyangiaceae bacterium]